MARPRPKILKTRTDQKHITTDVLDGLNAVYVVCCNGQPINLRKQHALADHLGKKYLRTAFVGNPGHAFNLAERLNTMFKTDRFSVQRMVDSIEVTEEEVTGRRKR